MAEGRLKRRMSNQNFTDKSRTIVICLRNKKAFLWQIKNKSYKKKFHSKRIVQLKQINEYTITKWRISFAAGWQNYDSGTDEDTFNWSTSTKQNLHMISI